MEPTPRPAPLALPVLLAIAAHALAVASGRCPPVEAATPLPSDPIPPPPADPR